MVAGPGEPSACPAGHVAADQHLPVADGRARQPHAVSAAGDEGRRIIPAGSCRPTGPKPASSNECTEVVDRSRRPARSSSGRSSACWRGASSAASARATAGGRRALRRDEVRIAHGRLPAARRTLLVQVGDTVRGGDDACSPTLPAAPGRCRTTLEGAAAACRCGAGVDGARASAAASTCCRACSRWRTCSAATPASSTRCAASSRTAAPFIGFAIVLDMLDGRIARMTGTTSAFGVEFDSLADVMSFGVAPAMLCVRVGPAAARPARLGGRLPVRGGGGGAAGALQHPAGVAGQALFRRHAEPGGGRRARGDRVRLSRRVPDRLPYDAARRWRW